MHSATPDQTNSSSGSEGLFGLAKYLPKALQGTQGKSENDEPINAIDLLKSQHREVEALFEEFEELGDRAFKRKEQLASTICEKLQLHTKIEELYFYPAAKKADTDLVLEAAEEHLNVKNMMARITKAEGSDESFDAKVTTMKELVEHHVKEEENDLFPKCKVALGEEKLEEIGRKMQHFVNAKENTKDAKAPAKKATKKKNNTQRQASK